MSQVLMRKREGHVESVAVGWEEIYPNFFFLKAEQNKREGIREEQRKILEKDMMMCYARREKIREEVGQRIARLAMKSIIRRVWDTEANDKRVREELERIKEC